MRKSTVIASGVLFTMFGLTAWAQTEYPKAELALNYSLVRFVPNSPYLKNRDLNGGGGSITFNFTEYLGIKADFQGYNSVTHTLTIPPGTLLPRGGDFSVSGNLSTYLFGPQFKYHKGKVAPFGELLFGGAHSNVFASLDRACGPAGAEVCTVSGSSPGSNAFAMAVGGGLDINLGKTIAIRPVQFDYLLTRFSTRFSSNQNNFRYQAGILFNFGNK